MVVTLELLNANATTFAHIHPTPKSWYIYHISLSKHLCALRACKIRVRRFFMVPPLHGFIDPLRSSFPNPSISCLPTVDSDYVNNPCLSNCYCHKTHPFQFSTYIADAPFIISQVHNLYRSFPVFNFLSYKLFACEHSYCSLVGCFRAHTRKLNYLLLLLELLTIF